MKEHVTKRKYVCDKHTYFYDSIVWQFHSNDRKFDTQLQTQQPKLKL
jgi:hypothetical protein